MEIKKIRYLLVLLLIIVAWQVKADLPAYSDSRIKTFIYNDNEIYRLLVQFGFQTSIEFADNEEVETISLGDSFAWRTSVVGRRLFIKPLQKNIFTNMTIITNRRAYNFEIMSLESGEDVTDLLAYVVRFYYPQETSKGIN